MIDLQDALQSIYRYPLKGLTGEKLSSVLLQKGETLPYDRAYAFENGNGRFDPANPSHLPKSNFLMLMRNEKLAKLTASFEDDSKTLILRLGNDIVAQGCLEKIEDRKQIEEFIADFMDEKDLRGRPHIVQAANHSFSDVKEKCVHIVNLATLREIEKVMNTKLDPLRFRANIYIDDIPPWEEFDWIDQDFNLGEATARVFKRTIRCLAVNVDPQTGVRDSTNIPIILKQNFGHSDVGLYATITQSGLVTAP